MIFSTFDEAKMPKHEVVPDGEMKVDLRDLIKNMDFTEETLVDAMLNQAGLLLQASYYRVDKMRARMKTEARLSETTTRIALNIRSENAEVKITEANVRELTEANSEVQTANRIYNEAKAMEEWAKLIIDSYQMRGSMAKALVQLLGAEAAMESGFIRAEMERLGLGRLKDAVRKRFPFADPRQDASPLLTTKRSSKV